MKLRGAGAVYDDTDVVGCAESEGLVNGAGGIRATAGVGAGAGAGAGAGM